jgi:MurNAc alpha-1-phosphate uridylyltransferase
MAYFPKKAFVLAAGKGERMRPLTDNCPKPLLAVGGRTMLDRALDALEEAGVEDVVVNAWYLADMIEAHLQKRKTPRIRVVREETLLDTGGGVRAALPFFGDDPFFVLNADILWTEGAGDPALVRMARMWDDAKMDLILMLQPLAGLPSWNGGGDYHLDEGSDKPVFAKGGNLDANYVFAGPRLVHPRLFEGAPAGAFSFLQLFHKAEKAGRLYALRHDGDWHHVGTPAAFEETNKLLAAAARRAAT